MLGRGGMGEVYLARDLDLDRLVALKFLHADIVQSAENLARFHTEARAISALNHPYIATIFAIEETGGLRFLVLEYLPGGSLRDRLDARRAAGETLPAQEAAAWGLQVAEGLAHAHRHEIVHRDIKASNVIVEPLTTLSSNRTHRAILMDFGIARFVSERTKITMTGDMLGTAEYISPEQIQGASDLDGRADQYSLGVLAYMMLTGKKPFERHNTWAMIKSHLEEPPPDPREIVPGLSEAATDAIMKAMAKKPEERFTTTGEFIEALGK
jgi:serine/threonine-protein kinase